jgi:succinate dehydrogenase/fumarate reductase flavoprotein subunit
MAALRARQNKNIDVAIMERGTIWYGGNAIGFDDHNLEYPGIIEHPLPSNFSPEQAAKGEFGARRFHNIVSAKLAVTEARNYVKPLVVLEEIGVKIREDDGTVKVKQTQKIPGGPNWHRLVPDANGKIEGDKVFYRGSDVKEKLANAVVRSGARIYNRTILTNLITRNDTVVGAVGMNTRTGKLLVFIARAVLVATGDMRRLYTYPYAPFPNNLFLNSHFAGNHGGGIAAAFRAGAKLANMEFLQVYVVAAGACATSAAGAGMYWRMQNSKGEFLEEKYQGGMLSKIGGHFPPTNFVFSPSINDPEFEREVITYDTSNATDDEVISCYFTCATEYPRMLKLHKLAGGIRKGPVEAKVFIPGLLSGIVGVLSINEKAETTVKNLYIAGCASSATGSSGSKAMVWGHIVGDHIREVVSDIEPPALQAGQLQQIQAEKERVMAPLAHQGGADPLELEEYVRQVNTHYVNVRKVEPKLKRAVALHQEVRNSIVPLLSAANPHELMHALEVQDIIELSEMHAQASLMRTESRMTPSHYRMDYPDQDNENWGNIIITAQNIAGKTSYTRERIE